MSRVYSIFCEKCREYNSRKGYVSTTSNGEDISLVQCLEKECGAMYVSWTVSKKIRTVGTSETAWSKGIREALNMKIISMCEVKSAKED